MKGPAGMVRWSWLAPRLAVLGLVWVLSSVLVDPLLERGLERQASKALGARVDFGAFHTRALPPAVRLKDFTAADPEQPMRNLVEFSAARLALEGRPLLEKKIVVRSAELEGLAFGTARKRSGVFKSGPPTRAEAALSQWSAEAKEAGKGFGANAQTDLTKEYRVDPDELASVKLAKELEARWPARLDEWKKKIEAFDAEGKAQALSKAAEGLGGGGNLAEKALKLKDLKEKADALKKGAEELRRGYREDLERFQADLRAVEAAKKSDTEAIRKRLHLPSFDAERLSSYLLGPRGAARVAKVLRFVEAARKRMPPKGAPARQEARRGQNIEFRKERSWPAFWLRKARVSGAAELGTFAGEMSDFSTSPALVPEPARLSLRGGTLGRVFELDLELDHRGETPRDAARFKAENLPVAGFEAGEPGSLQVSVGPGTASLEGRLEAEGDALRGRVRFVERGLRLQARPQGVPAEAARLIEASLAGIQELQADIELGGTLQEPRLSVSSSLGRAVSGAMAKALGKELEARTKNLQEQVDKALKGHTDKLSGLLGEQAKGPLAKLGAGDARVQELLQKLQKNLGVPGLPDLKRLFR